VNTNAFMPIIDLDADVDGHRSWLSFKWTDGTGAPQQRSVKLDWDAHGGGEDDLQAAFIALSQHCWLMGHEAGVVNARVAGEDGYSHGAHVDFPNPYERTDDRHEAFERGRNRRQLDNESGARIEALNSQRVAVQTDRDELRRQLATVTSERDEAIEHCHALAQELVEAQEQRDAIAESAEQLATAPMPTVDAFIHGVTVYRSDSNFNVTHWVPEGDDGEWTNEYLASQLRGAFADAFHRGADEMETSMRAEMEREAERVRGFDQNIANQARIIQEQQATIADYEHDFDIVREALLEEAQNRSWCSEYDDYASGVNARTRRFDLITRSKNWNVTVTVTQTVDYSVVDNAASNFGFPISYDVSGAEATGVDYFFTLEDLSDNQIAARAEELRRVIYNNVSEVSDARVEWEETD